MKISSALVLRCVLVAGCFVSASLPILAGPNHWTCGGPFEGDVNVIAIDPGNPLVLYAGTEYGGVFRSMDHGASWGRMSSGLEIYRTDGLSISALALDPTVPKAFINGAEWTSVVYKNAGKVQLTGAGLKAAVPKGTPTNFSFVNSDGGKALVEGWNW